MEDSQKVYNSLVEKLIAIHEKSGLSKTACEKKAIEDARYVFPNGCETKVIFTMNARTLFNFFKHRCCNRAQWEIRELAFNMLKEVKKVSPILFKNCGPACLKGVCPEGKMTCGEMAKVKEKYSEI